MHIWAPAHCSGTWRPLLTLKVHVWVQVRTYPTLMVGEHAAVSVTVDASSDCPAQQGFITASYAEGGEPPLLCNSLASGEVKLPEPLL